MPRRSLLLGTLVLLAAGIRAGELHERPSSYSEFVPITRYASFAEAFASERYLFVPQGRYVVDNPVVISRSEPLFLHGADRARTLLVPRNDALPLFIVEEAPILSLLRLHILPPKSGDSWQMIAIATRNEKPLVFEMQDTMVDEAALLFEGPGSYRLEAPVFNPRGAVHAPLVLDHPEADLVVVGGNISTQGYPALRPGERFFHVWQKRGRLRIYGTGVQAALGSADFRLESASGGGPHVIANVRSEGSNGATQGAQPSALVEVSQSDEPVDVLLLSNSGNWLSTGRGRGHLLDYNAAGRAWLVGNNSFTGAGSLVIGKSQRAQLVAIGNVLYDHQRTLPDNTRGTFSTGNLHAHRIRTGSPLPPNVRRIETMTTFPDGEAIPEIPSEIIPVPLPRIAVLEPLPGMLDVKSFGAVGDGVHDDTKAIQRALDAGCDRKLGKVLYFPAGTYRTSATLYYNHRRAGCQDFPSGGWIAGAGSGRSVIARDATSPGSVFASHGLAYVDIQGLTFRAAPFRDRDPGGARASNFALENAPGVGNASQSVTFYDVVFDGGYSALGIGLEPDSVGNCSENLMIHSAFKNAHHGLGIGHYNALANIVYSGTFENNAVTMGHVEGKLSGGTWTVIGASVSGTRERELVFINSAGGAWYFYGLDSDTPRMLAPQNSGAIFPLVFEGSQLRPESLPADGISFDFGAAGGVSFLHSQVSRIGIRLARVLTTSYAFNLYSGIQGWRSARSGGDSVLMGALPLAPRDLPAKLAPSKAPDIPQ